MDFISNSYEDTHEIGKIFSKTLKPGDTVILIGDLGAGKTAFTTGVADGFGIKDHVSSPTFTIVNEYLSGDIPIYHFDLYRLLSEDDLYDIGVDEYLEKDGICIFEWPELVINMMENYYKIEILKDFTVSEEYRKIIITKIGS